MGAGSAQKGGSFGDKIAQRRMQQGQGQGQPQGGSFGDVVAQRQAQPQGLGALQTAYTQFANQPPPQPNPLFGQQPDAAAVAQQTSSVLDSYMGLPQTPMTPPATSAPPAPPPMPASVMPPAPNFGQIAPEDPRMQAMRYMQRYRGFQ